MARTMRAHEVISFWGDQAKEFKEMIVGGTGTYAEQAEAFTAGDSAIDDTTPEFRKVTVFDYTDSVNRYVWVTPNAMLSELSVVPTEGVPIMNPTPHGLGFIPWVCVSGGTSMESQSEHRYKPMLYSVVQSGQFETQVITDTLVMTEALLNFTSARRKDSGPNPDSIDEVYEDGSSVLKVPAGHTSEVIDKPQLDQNLLLLADRLASRMDKSTVSRILMGGGVPGETTFSAMNLMTQTAVGAIKPYQELAELAIAEGLTQMLLWVAEQDDETEVPAYQLDERMKMSGSQFTLMPNQIEPEAIYIDVKLEADAPTDKIQRVNAANLARGFGYPKVRALEDIGVTDPDVALRQSYTEDIQETLIATEKEKIIARAQLEIQALVSGAQQAMMPQPDQQPVDEGQPAAVGQDGIPLIGGPGFDPAQGGTPPAVAAPEVTRETQTGTARDGAEIA